MTGYIAGGLSMLYLYAFMSIVPFAFAIYGLIKIRKIIRSNRIN